MLLNSRPRQSASSLASACWQVMKGAATEDYKQHPSHEEQRLPCPRSNVNQEEPDLEAGHVIHENKGHRARISWTRLAFNFLMSSSLYVLTLLPNHLLVCYDDLDNT